MPGDRSIQGSGASGKRARIADKSPPCSTLWLGRFPGAGVMLGRAFMFASLALVAVAIEVAVGYPEPLYRAIGHPVTWIGRLIAWADDVWNSPTASFEQRRGMGVVLLLVPL